MLKWVVNILLVFLNFSLLSTAFAQSNPARQEFDLKVEENKYGSRSYYGDVGFTLMGRRYDDPFVSSRWSRAIVEANMGVKYEDWLEGKLSVVQLMTSGAASYQMGVTEGGPGSGLILDEASITLKPTPWVQGAIGVINVGFNPITSLFYTQSFAGGEVEFSQSATTGMGEFKITATGSQSIPTAKNSGSMITDEGTGPLLTVGTLMMGLKNEETGTELKIAGAHFEFTDLSTAAAADSLRTGSSVVGTKDFQFLYEFRGQELGAGISQKIGLSHEVELKASEIRNERAPAGLNSGRQIKAEYTRTFDKWEITPSIQAFRIESDAIPSLYGQSGIGMANRKGYAVNLKANFPKEKFNVYAGYTKADAIRKAGKRQVNTETSTYQDDREVFTVGAEVTYDIF